MKTRLCSMTALLVALSGCGDDGAGGAAATSSSTTGDTTTGTCCPTTSSATTNGTSVASTSVGTTTTTTASSSSTGGGDVCDCAQPMVAGKVGSDEITEASGIAASRVHPGVLYVHNDSGDSARFFAIDATGALLATYELDGASAVDWEDMAAGPCAGLAGNCLYFGDFGDNGENRDDYRIHRVVEPDVITPGTHDIAFETQAFAYPDGSHNAETLLVHPTTGEIAIVQKKMGEIGVYTLAAPGFAGSETFTKAAAITLPGVVDLATGGDVRGDGTVLVRTYLNLYSFAAGASLGDTLTKVPCALPVTLEGQGEAVAWSSDGTSYTTLSEGEGESLNVATCAR